MNRGKFLVQLAKKAENRTEGSAQHTGTNLNTYLGTTDIFQGDIVNLSNNTTLHSSSDVISASFSSDDNYCPNKIFDSLKSTALNERKCPCNDEYNLSNSSTSTNKSNISNEIKICPAIVHGTSINEFTEEIAQDVLTSPLSSEDQSLYSVRKFVSKDDADGPIKYTMELVHEEESQININNTYLYKLSPVKSRPPHKNVTTNESRYLLRNTNIRSSYEVSLLSSSDDSKDNDYIPSDDNSEQSFQDSEEESMANINMTTTEASISGREQQQNLDVISTNQKFLVSENIPIIQNNATLQKDLCPFCYEEVGHFSRHLLRKHCEEEEVKKISKMPLKSNNRRIAIVALRKKGNFVLNVERNILKPVRKNSTTRNIDRNNNEGDYVPCKYCLGFFKKKYLWRHAKICKSKCSTLKKNSRTQHLSEVQTFLAATGLLGNFLSKSRIKAEVFDIMRPDQISAVAKNDSLICLYGESYLNKHKRKQMNVVVSNKLRELARLKIAMQKSTTIENLIDILKPEMLNHITTATKIISGFDPKEKTYKASSLALHMGTTLIYLCDVAKKALMIKDPLFTHLERESTLKNINELREMIKSHWCNDVSSLANKILNEKKWDKPKLVPLTEDVLMFNNYVMNLAKQAFAELNMKNNVSSNYKVLCECTLALTLVFNRKRIGELQFLNIQSYERNVVSMNQDESLKSLSELERAMSATFKRVIVFGKGSKPVAILFTKRMQTFVEALLEVRRSTNIVPASNQYIFANPGSADRWMNGSSVIRKFAFKCGAKNPELLTSTRFRKQIATILQLMNFENVEMEQIARFMGHTEKTHREFYRLTEDIYQTAKVAKVLLLLNEGRGLEFKGKSLSEIEVAEDIVEFDKEDEHEMIANIEENYEKDAAIDSTFNNNNNNNIVKSVTYVTSNICLGKSKSLRKRWSEEEKKIVCNYFKKHVKTKTAPKKEECLTLVREHPNTFIESDWVRIKTLVYNTYRSKGVS